jgi:ribosome maturation factor RimP
VDDKRLAGLIQPVVAAAGMDLESVRVSMAGKRRLLRIVVDADGGVTLDDTAEVSHAISALLDAASAMGEVAYTLEVSSPGVDRPLAEPRHWRRARKRLVKVKVAGERPVTGRVLATSDDGVTLDVAGSRRDFEYGALGPGAIQVEFGPLPDDDGDDPGSAEPDFDEVEEDEELSELLEGLDDGDVTDEADNDGAGGDGH